MRYIFNKEECKMGTLSGKYHTLPKQQLALSPQKNQHHYKNKHHLYHHFKKASHVYNDFQF